MLQPYKDIVSRLGQPLWWDEVGCPRYEPFTPRLCNNIYAIEAVLVKIGCQGCRKRFLVAITRGAFVPYDTLRVDIMDGVLHYGDPPPHSDCAAGATMNCLDLRVVEYWRMSPLFEWVRDETYELELGDG